MRMMAWSGHFGLCPRRGIVDTSERSIQVRGEESKRRFRTVEEKRRIVEETLEPNASVARVARAHGVNANQVFGWRRQYRQGLLGDGNAEAVSLLPVHVTGARASKANRSVKRQATHRATEAAGAIHVGLPKGHLRIVGRVDAEALRGPVPGSQFAGVPGGGGGGNGCIKKTVFVLKRLNREPSGPGSFSGTLLVGWPSGVTFSSIAGNPEVVPAAVTEEPFWGIVTFRLAEMPGSRAAGNVPKGFFVFC
jgi:transposase